MRDWIPSRAKIAQKNIVNNNKIVRFVFEEMFRQQMHERDFSERIGVHRNTLRDWRKITQPRITDIEACLDLLGYKLKIVKKGYGEKYED